MEGKKINPFVTVGYVSPEYFCDREKETARLISTIYQDYEGVT